MPHSSPSRRTPPRPRAGRRLAAALLLATSCLAARQSRIVPPEPAPPVSVSGDRVSVQLAGVEIALELLEGPERLRFLGERGAGEEDLFAPDPGGRYQFTTFRLELINRTRQEVSLHPSAVTAVADAVPYFPVEYTASYEHFVSRRGLDPGVVEDLGRAVFLETIVVPPGGKISGLLAFQDLPLKFKRFRVSCNNILVGAESKSFSVPFGVVRERVKRRGEAAGRGPQPRSATPAGALP